MTLNRTEVKCLRRPKPSPIHLLEPETKIRINKDHRQFHKLINHISKQNIYIQYINNIYTNRCVDKFNRILTIYMVLIKGF